MSRRCGEDSNARPIATRCRSPPDSRPGRRARTWPMPSVSTTASKPTGRCRAASVSPAGGRCGQCGQWRLEAPANQRPNIRFCRTVRCGNKRPSWWTRPIRRACFGTKTRDLVSTSTRPSTTTRPWSGRSRPAISAIVTDLPAPERPNRATTAASLSKAASRLKAPSVIAALKRIIRTEPVAAAPCVARSPKRSARRARSRSRSRSAARPRRRRPAPGCKYISPTRASVSRPVCWRRR